jgi:putative transposase
MSRHRRQVVVGSPHHVTQRGTRRMTVFLAPGDAQRYLRVVARAARRNGVELWAYCLMPNHVHWIACPTTPTGLARTFGEAHRSYAVELHRDRRWTGHFWQQRFFSCPLDEVHLLAVVRYVLANPVRAKLVSNAVDWPYSSVRAHVEGEPDPAVDPAPLAARIEDWVGLLATEPSEDELARIRRAAVRGSFDRLAERRGRPRKARETGAADSTHPSSRSGCDSNS